MSKSIIIIDTPSGCLECPFKNRGEYMPADKPFRYELLYNCMFEPEHCDEKSEEFYMDFINDHILAGTKPDWCPLKKLPEKKGETKTLSEEYNNEKNLIAKGYNLCISHILGEELPNF